MRNRGYNPADIERKASEAVAEWNARYPTGTRVRVYPVHNDERTAFDTTTRSEAWVMGGHSAMVMIAGQAGGYALRNIKPLIGQAPHYQGESAAEVDLDPSMGAALADQLRERGEEVAV